MTLTTEADLVENWIYGKTPEWKAVRNKMMTTKLAKETVLEKVIII